MSKAAVYGLIRGFRFDNLSDELAFNENISLCITPDNIKTKLLDSCRDSLSPDDFSNIEKCQYSVKLLTNDTNEEIDETIKQMHQFLSVLRVIKPILAYPQYIFSYHENIGNFFLRVKSPLCSCYSIQRKLEFHKFPIEQLSEVRPLWMNVPQIVRNGKRVWAAHWLSEKAYIEKYHEFRVLFFAVALESLFSLHEANLTRNLAGRAANFLISDEQLQGKCIERICLAYNVRSKIVHGSDERIRETELLASEIIFRETVRSSLLKIIPDENLIRIFDGNIENYQNYFNGL